MELEVGDAVLCTVDRVVGTVVFVRISKDGEEKEGSIVMSEVAPGRIRNIRDYIVPKKKIVCKVLRISNTGNIDLSLRRVTPKESKEVKEKTEEEQSYVKILKSILKEKADEIIGKIKEKENIYDFFRKTKEDSRELEKIIDKNDASKILEILRAQKKKKATLKKEINLSSISPNGINEIKEIFKGIKNVKIKYISGGRYSLEKEADDIKTADNEIRKILEEIEKKAKNKRMDFSIREK